MFIYTEDLGLIIYLIFYVNELYDHMVPASDMFPEHNASEMQSFFQHVGTLGQSKGLKRRQRKEPARNLVLETFLMVAFGLILIRKKIDPVKYRSYLKY